MTEKGTVAWMKEKGYYKRWILPELGVNDGIGSFGGRPVGNCPEFMPWDACLNNDAHDKQIEASSSKVHDELVNSKLPDH